jgi:hypothetical protein
VKRIGLIAAALLIGCQPTPYQRLGQTSAGGYSHQKLAEDTYYVRFVANTHTSPEIVRRYLYRHAAELTLKHRYRWFVVLRGPSAITSRMDLTPYEDHINYHGPQVRPPSVLDVDVPNARRQKMVIRCSMAEPEYTGLLCIEARSLLE